jgi:hypothetical protein
VKLLERLARTLRELTKQNGRQCHGDDETGWRYYVDDARAVLAAIRQPSEEMVSHGALQLAEGDGVDVDLQQVAAAWRQMIDAALAEG